MMSIFSRFVPRPCSCCLRPMTFVRSEEEKHMESSLWTGKTKEVKREIYVYQCQTESCKNYGKIIKF